MAIMRKKIVTLLYVYCINLQYAQSLSFFLSASLSNQLSAANQLTKTGRKPLFFSFSSAATITSSSSFSSVSSASPLSSSEMTLHGENVE